MAKGAKGGKKANANSADFKRGYEGYAPAEIGINPALFNDKDFNVKERKHYLKGEDSYNRMPTEQFLQNEIDRLEAERNIARDNPLNAASDDLMAGIDKAFQDAINKNKYRLREVRKLRAAEE